MRTFLHIGPHRTGTTSVQTYLQHRLGPPMYPLGGLFPHLHLEAALVALAPEQLGPLALARRAADADQLRTWVRAAREAGTDLVLSCETLSFVRDSDGVDRLLDVLTDGGATMVEVIVVHRDPATFLPSYRFAATITARSSLRDYVVALTDDEVSEDSWLVDHEARVALWSARCRVHVLGYEDEVARQGSVVPAIAGLVGAPPDASADVGDWLNSSAELRAAVEAAIRERHRQD